MKNFSVGTAGKFIAVLVVAALAVSCLAYWALRQVQEAWMPSSIIGSIAGGGVGGGVLMAIIGV